MKPHIKLASVRSPTGNLLELFEHDGEHEIRSDGLGLMASRKHRSEEDLARLACEDLPPRPTVMIGGLGIGYTLRAALDLLPPDGRAIQVELVPEVAEWNRGPLAHHADHPLDDGRTELVIADITETVKGHQGTLAAIMLDADNGPSAKVEPRSLRLYTKAGLAALYRALLPGGRVTIWSIENPPAFTARMRAAGFDAHVHSTHARPGRRSGKHFVFVGRKPS